MQVELKNVKLKMIERVSFKDDKGVEVEFYYLTFIDTEFLTKIVFTSKESYSDYEDKVVNATLDLFYSEFEGKKVTKLKVARLDEVD